MDKTKFKDLLNKNYTWPCIYIFRFVIPFTELSELERILPKEGMKFKPSKMGNYISVVIKMTMNSADEVIEIYKKVSHIKGIISL